MKHSLVRLPGAPFAPPFRVVVDDEMPLATTVFVVGPRLVRALSRVPFLAAARVHVASARTYTEAKRRLVHARPDLLFTELQLGAFNGLGLVVRAKSLRATTRAIVVSRVIDPVLRAEAEKLGATLVQMPRDPVELRGAALRTIFQGGWPGAS